MATIKVQTPKGEVTVNTSISKMDGIEPQFQWVVEASIEGAMWIDVTSYHTTRREAREAARNILSTFTEMGEDDDE